MLDSEATEYEFRLLHDYRRTLAQLLRTAAQHGGESFAPPAVTNGITEARQQIQRIKETLRANGIVIDDQPEDDPPPELDSRSLASPHLPITIINNPIERNVSTDGGDYAEGNIDKRQGVFWEHVRIPLALIILVIVIIVAANLISAGTSLLGVLAPDPTAVPTAEPLLFAPEQAGETLIVIRTFFLSEGSSDQDVANKLKEAIQQAAADLSLAKLRVEVAKGSRLQANNRADAEALAEKYQASIVVWGADNEGAVTVSYLNLRQPDFNSAKVKIDKTSYPLVAKPEASNSYITRDFPDHLPFLSLLVVAQSAYIRSEYGEATYILDRAITELDNNGTPPAGSAEAYFQLGWLYQEPGNNMGKAIRAYDQAIKLNSQDTAAYYNRGIARSEQGNYIEAIVDFDQAIKLDPKFAAAYHERCIARHVSRDLAGAIADCNQAIKLDPKFAAAYNSRGIARAKQEDYAKAIEDYDQTIEIDPKFAAAYYNRGNVRWEQGHYDEAITDYDRAIELNPEYADAYFQRGRARVSQEDYGRAIADYDQVIKLDPQFAAAYFQRGVAKFLQEDFDAAMADYDQAIKLDNTFTTAYLQRGLMRYGRGDYEAAIADFDQVIKLLPDDPAGYNNRGNARVKKGDLAGAIADFDQAIKLNPQTVEPYNSRADARYAQGDYAGAFADLDQVIKLNPQDAAAYYNRGQARFYQRDYAGAIADFDQAIKLNPQDAAAYQKRGFIRRNIHKDYAGAIADFDQVIKLTPQSTDGYYNRGLAHRDAGQKEQAIADFKTVLTLSNDRSLRQKVEQFLQELE